MKRVAVIATIGLAVMAASCGGGPSSTASGGSSGTGASTGAAQLAFSRCMHTNGVPNFPEPGGGGGIPKVSIQQLGVSSSQFEKAQHACSHLLPNGGQPTRAETEHVLAQSVRFSRCMRTHGVTGFPDPGSDGRIPDPASLGIDQGSPRFEAANQACARYRPPYIPSNAAYNAYARSNGS